MTSLPKAMVRGGLRSMPTPATILLLKAWQNCPTPPDWKTLLKVYFQQFMIVFSTLQYSKQCLKRKIHKNRFKAKIKREKL